MMNKFFLLFVLLLTSCSTTKIESNRKYASNEQVKLEDDYNWVESIDFDKKAETKYKADKDEFSTKSQDEKASVLAKESVATMSFPRLEEQYKENDDNLSKIVIRCYQKKFDEAFNEIDKLYSQYKNNTSYWNQVGSCYYLKEDFSKAILFFNKSRDLDPKFSPPLNNLGVVFQKQGRYQKALAAFKKANDLNSFAVTPAFNLARLYLQFGMVNKSESILTGLYKSSENDPQVNSALASLYLIKNQIPEALKIFSTLSKEQLTRPEAGLNYALALKFSNKTEEAKNVLQNIQETDGEVRVYAHKVEAFIKE